MEENIKKQLISEISQFQGYEKAIEIVDSIEYINYLNDEKINLLIEFFYSSNQKLISDNTFLINKINEDKKTTRHIIYILLFSIFINFLMFLK